MLQRNRAPRIAAIAATLGLLSCHNPKASNKENFKRTIQMSLDKHPVCLPVALPDEPRSMIDAKPITDPQLDALVDAGLAGRKRVMMENSGWTIFGGPKQIPGTRYDFTPEGLKYASHQEHSGLLVGRQALCYGVPEVIDIVRYSEPGNALGQTTTEVTYTYALKAVPPWVKKPVLIQQFPDLATIPTRDHPRERSLDLVLMNDGWRVANLLN